MLPSLNKTAVLTALQKGEINLQGQFILGSNYTFLAQLTYETETYPVVYKPRRGEKPLWDFPQNTLGKREVAAFLVSEALGWELVPPIVYRKKGPFGPGSLQLYIDHDPEYHFFNFSETDRQRLRSAALFDLVVNNADRKGGHILVGKDGHLWLIDHGICFNKENKLRTVIWDFIGEPLPPDLLVGLQGMVETLKTKGELYFSLRSMLKVGEITALIYRTQELTEGAIFPPPTTRYPIPYPPI